MERSKQINLYDKTDVRRSCCSKVVLQKKIYKPGKAWYIKSRQRKKEALNKKESPGSRNSEAFALGWAAFMYHPRPATCRHSRQLCSPIRRVRKKEFQAPNSPPFYWRQHSNYIITAPCATGNPEIRAKKYSLQAVTHYNS